MKLSDEMQKTIKSAPYLTFISINDDGTPYPIIAGGKDCGDDTVNIGIYKMEVTQKNLSKNSKAWIAVASTDGGPKGFRFKGTAEVKDGKVIFTPDIAEVLI
jgi:Predicted flavin-nucleotide-binding protein structurally related to pyridoxine 5''-phosphate oxidase